MGQLKKTEEEWSKAKSINSKPEIIKMSGEKKQKQNNFGYSKRQW